MENTQQTIHFYQIDSIQFENKVHNKRINVCVCALPWACSLFGYIQVL